MLVFDCDEKTFYFTVPFLCFVLFEIRTIMRKSMYEYNTNIFCLGKAILCWRPAARVQKTPGGGLGPFPASAGEPSTQARTFLSHFRPVCLDQCCGSGSGSVASVSFQASQIRILPASSKKKTRKTLIPYLLLCDVFMTFHLFPIFFDF